MTNHTPGPWENDGGLVAGRESRERFQPGTSVDIFDASDYPNELHEEMLATAALIAAAPDLLAALKAILPWHDSHPAEATDNPLINQCRAAIAKATQP